jgi:hypothetical protein
MASRQSKREGAKSPPPLPESFPVSTRSLYDDLLTTDDEWAAHCFLAGYEQQFSPDGRPINRDLSISHDDDPGYVRVVYLTGKNEAFGREALVRILEEPKKPLANHLLLTDLAGLFALDSPEERTLKFQRRSRSRPEGISSKDFAVEHFIEKQKRRGLTLTEAIKKAQDIFGYQDPRSIKKVLQRQKRRRSESTEYVILKLDRSAL